MAKNWFTRWLGRGSRPTPFVSARVRTLEALEAKVTPTILLGNVTIQSENPATPNQVLEGEVAVLTATYTAINPIGTLTLVIDWGDNPGNPPPPVPVVPQSIAVQPGVNQTVTVRHRYLDDNPTGTPIDLATVTVRLIDSGPSTIVNQDNSQLGRYDAYDIPGYNINLGDAFAALGAASGVTPVASLDNANNNTSATVTFNGSFTYYGKQYSAANATENGLLAFDGTNTSGTNGSLTTTTAPALVAPFWTDLRTGIGVNSRVFTRAVDLNGDGGNDWFIIEWHNVRSATGSTDPVTFQAILQLGTGTTNGDIIFNYVDTNFNNPAINFGVNLNIGIKSGFNPTPAPGVGTPQTGNTSFTGSQSRTGDGQAVRFSVADAGLTRITGPNQFGYSAFRMPFLTELTGPVTPGATELGLTPPPATPVGPRDNFGLLGGAGAFTDEEASPTAQQVGNSNFTYYGNEIPTLNFSTSGRGYVRLAGTSPTPADVNTNLGTSPNAALVAALWDEWVGPNPPTSLVIGRLVDIDGDVTTVTTDADKAEFFIIEWSNLQNNGVTTTPAPTATWQVIFELNTGSNDSGDIYFNYLDTDVGVNAISGGASATVGIKNTGDTNPPTDPLLALFNPGSPSGNVLANIAPATGTATPGRTIGIFQVSSQPVTATITVINVAPTILDSTLGNGQTVEGQTFTRTIQFTDPSGFDLAGTTIVPGAGDFFNFTVNWGDGFTENLTVPAGTRSFNINHIYRDDGTFTTGTGTYTVTIQNFRDDDTGTVTPDRSFTVTVANEAPVLTLATQTFLIVPGQPFSFPSAGTFRDSGVSYDNDGAGPTGTREFIFIDVDWRDGTPIETVQLPSNGNISGTVVPAAPLSGVQYQPTTGTLGLFHRFNGVGAFEVMVTIRDDDGGLMTQTFVVEVGPPNVYAVAADAGGQPLVRVFSSRLNLQYAQFLAYEATFSGGVRVAAGKVNGDTLADYVTAPGFGGGPIVKIFDGATRAAYAQLVPYDINFRGGVYVAVGDVNGDGFADIATGAGETGGPHVRIFSGLNGTILFDKIVFDPAFRGGVRVALADVTGDGRNDLIAAAGPGGGPHVKVFNVSNGALVSSFFPYATNFTGGVFVSGADFTGDGFAEVVTGPGIGGGPHLRVIDVARNNVVFETLAFPPGSPTPPPGSPNTLWQSGLRVAVTAFGVGDPPTLDGQPDIVVGPAVGQQSFAKILDGGNLSELYSSRFFDPTFLGGVFVGGNA